jgi:predicted GH43/DUF377 family glycosyl hydrolase
LGVIMRPARGDPREAWGVLNPGGIRAPDGVMHLFPRLIAQGNVSRIGHARVRFDGDIPVDVERLGIALQPEEPYEVNSLGGGVEDPRVVYIAAIKTYVMTYTAFVPYEPRVAIAVSEDLLAWRRLGLVRYTYAPDELDLNQCRSKDAAFFSGIVSDPAGVPSLALLHRPTTRPRSDVAGMDALPPPSDEETRERIWISYVPLAAVAADRASLRLVSGHERVMAPEQPWEAIKIGTGAPPVRMPYGWLLPYHAVAIVNGQPRYCMGIAVLDLERPARVLYRTHDPILQPQEVYEVSGLVSNVVFPTASDLRADNHLDIYYGAADRVIAVARVTLPQQLPSHHQLERELARA